VIRLKLSVLVTQVYLSNVTIQTDVNHSVQDITVITQVLRQKHAIGRVISGVPGLK